MGIGHYITGVIEEVSLNIPSIIHFVEGRNQRRPGFDYVILGGGVQLGPLGTAATNGLLCQPRVIMMMEKLVE
jgi:hypothetical protein